MVIFHSCVSLPEGNHHLKKKTCEFPHVASLQVTGRFPAASAALWPPSHLGFVCSAERESTRSGSGPRMSATTASVIFTVGSYPIIRIHGAGIYDMLTLIGGILMVNVSIYIYIYTYHTWILMGSMLALIYQHHGSVMGFFIYGQTWELNMGT